MLPQFYQFPHFLMDLPISYTAKIVYMILYDRIRLSQKNGWMQDGRIFELYPIADIAQTIHRSISSVKTALNELESNGLLVRESGGFSKPNRLYVMIPEEAEVLTTTEPEIHPYDGHVSDHTAVSFPATSKVIESSYHNQSNRVKIAFGRYKNIFLSQDEYDDLIYEMPGRLEDLIESMSCYLASSGKQYKSYAAAIRCWDDRNQKQQRKTGKTRIDLYDPDLKLEEGTSL